MEPVELESLRVRLRLPREDDVLPVTAACQDPELQRWIPVPVPYDESHAREWIEDTAPSWAEDRELRWVIVDVSAGDDVALGAIGLHPRDDTMRELGYWLAAGGRGRGLMTDAARLACRWGFGTLGLRRIEWWAGVGNDASRAVAERVGFVMEGTCRARLLHRGDRLDGWVGGLLPGELRDAS